MIVGMPKKYPSLQVNIFWFSNFKNILNLMPWAYILTVCRIQLRAGSGNSSSTLTALALKPTIRSCLGASSFLRTWRLRWKNTEQLEEWKISGPHLIILLVGDWCFLSSLFWDLVSGQPPISKETQSLIDYQPAMFFWLPISRQLVHIKSEKG